jgi:hypothetical protein
MRTSPIWRRRSLAGAALAILLSLAVSGVARAQSLADVAKKEEDRRKATPAPAKVYTNKDLSHASEGGAAPSEAAKPADAAKDTAKDGQAKDAKAKDKDAAKEPVKDQAYWSGRLKALNEKLLRESNYVDAMQTRINALNTDFVNRDDPVQKAQVERDRQKALAELTKLKQDLVDDKKAIADLQEEARRAGVPAAWMR